MISARRLWPPGIYGMENNMELIRMKALRSWRNDDYEGVVSFGREFLATEDRARDLERSDLAVRQPLHAGETVEVKADIPQEPKRPLSAREAKKKTSAQSPLF
jgi:hypothetical protein